MVHLHTRSCYSLLQSSLRLSDIVEAAVAHGFRHAVLTDHHVMYGTMKFWHLCKEKNIHPIFGMEVESQLENNPIDFILLAKNDEGLQDLFRLSTHLSNLQEEKISVESLANYCKQTIVLTAGDSDWMDALMARNRYDELGVFLQKISSLFSDFYVSIAMNDAKYRANKNQELKELCQKIRLKTVALSKIYYLHKEDVEQLKILRAIDKKTSILDTTLDIVYDRYYRSEQEMQELYDEDDLQETENIARRCNVQMAMRPGKIPVFENKLHIDSETYLIKLCHAGLKKRLCNQVTKEYADRLEYELSVIISMHFTDYFLIVYDMIRFARSKNILIGPGRGSAVGSLVAYCLGITHIDPIKNHLLFERFLNPERISMPDIDTDIPDNRREEVVQYLIEKYGRDKVANIITFSFFKAKQALRDVGKVLGITNRQIDTIIQAIPTDIKDVTLRQAYEGNANFRKLIQSRKEYQNVFSWAIKIEGLPRHTSLHAAGVVISDQPIEKVCPLIKVDEDTWATQYTMEYLEELGLIKMDLLALRNLTTIDAILRNIKKYERKEISIFKLPLQDEKTYQLLSRADTVGIFQLESRGIKKLLKEMKPQRFEDISAVLALYRPGPMENISLYLESRRNPNKIQYAHPLLEPILKETYGIMIYQEQIMQIAQVVGGFTLSQADILRKAMSKKKKGVMEEYKEAFIQGALKRKVPFSVARDIFDTMEKFASYGFNKSHSYAYSMIVYQMAFLKANYPLYFYQSLLNSVIGDTEKMAIYVYECKKRNVIVREVDIQNSKENFSIEKGQLRMPFQVLKGIGKNICTKIIEEREKAPFKDLIDCIARLTMIHVNDKLLRTLIDAGALDCFGFNRLTLQENLNRILAYVNIIKVEDNGIHFDYSIASRPLIQKMKEDVLLKGQKEQEAYGFYLNGHPVETLRKERFPRLLPLSALLERKGYVSCLGRVCRVYHHKTKRGDMMAFVTIEDETTKFEITVMPNLYRYCKESLEVEKILFVEGKRENENSILVNKMKEIQIR